MEIKTRVVDQSGKTSHRISFGMDRRTMCGSKKKADGFFRICLDTHEIEFLRCNRVCPVGQL